MTKENPLLEKFDLPPFDRIKAEHIKPAIDELINNNKKSIEDLINNTQKYSWENFFQKIEDQEELLHQTWSPASHLHSVADNNDIRKAYKECIANISNHSTEIGQNKPLYAAYEKFSKSTSYKKLSGPQQKIIDNALKDFRLSGIELDEKHKKKYKKIQKEISELQTKFEENLLDATHSWKKHILKESELIGIPDSVKALAADTAKNENKKGWLFTLEFPLYMPVMKYAENVELRKEMYCAYVTRSSDLGPDGGKWDNTDLMYKILKLRTEKAKLLGFKNYAEYSLEKKMAKTPNEVMLFLDNLAKRSKKIAKKEYDELKKFAFHTEGLKNLDAWDIPYFSEKLRKMKFFISQEDLRRYFPVDQVIEGLFKITNKLYDVKILVREGVDTWHKDVKFFDILDNNNAIKGSFYLDLFSRRNKRGGAWMDECILRKKIGTTIQNPVAYLTCNFTPPVDGKPTLLTHDEVITLFHEFGHGLHHMMTKIDYSGVSGINGVPWDAVELPSQFMENFCWEKKALDLFACDYETGELISEDLFENMSKTRTFQTAMQMIRQLEFAIFDFRLHMEFSENEKLDIQTLIDDVRKSIAVIDTPSFNRFQNSFSHIFAGGYAAGYYSYKWAEVLSADAFSKFEEKGIFDKNTGKEFLETILEKGGSCEPMDLFVKFRGRKPKIDALLRHSGIAA